MNIAVLGTGNMGRALLRGVVERLGQRVRVRAWDSRPEARQELGASVKVQPPAQWFGADAVEMVVIAVKPADMDAALAQLKDAGPGPDVLWVSIAAGVGSASLERVLGGKAHVCRVMPNTPSMVGKGASAYALNAACSDTDGQRVRTVLEAVGVAVRVGEKLMNAVTGLSGSGPAYVYLFIESLIEGGVAAGLPYDTARELAVQTVAGAAEMVARSTQTPAALKAAVMSPGGTTVRGLIALEKSGMKFGVIQAVVDATRRAEELGS